MNTPPVEDLWQALHRRSEDFQWISPFMTAICWMVKPPI